MARHVVIIKPGDRDSWHSFLLCDSGNNFLIVEKCLYNGYEIFGYFDTSDKRKREDEYSLPETTEDVEGFKWYDEWMNVIGFWFSYDEPKPHYKERAA